MNLARLRPNDSVVRVAPRGEDHGHDVLIVGGGIAGLATALSLHSEGIDVAVRNQYLRYNHLGSESTCSLTPSENSMRSVYSMNLRALALRARPRLLLGTRSAHLGGITGTCSWIPVATAVTSSRHPPNGASPHGGQATGADRVVPDATSPLSITTTAVPPPILNAETVAVAPSR